MDTEIARVYGNRVRIRVCGLCWHTDKLLMVNHKFLNESDFWAPPGGGVELGESLEDALKREFQEETNLIVKPGKFIFGCEFIQSPLHAIELFFEATRLSGDLQTGKDPELPLIQGAAFFTIEEIRALPPDQVHGIFKLVKDANDLRTLNGFYKL
ncbi:NUDIX hydrolase [Ohtaekwangia sp.]|uniref:NUDIX hydrolase n=1 Tax=Ohtaekwangia sp. TaxID=2066019 RepID=UPI002F94F13C